MQTGSQSLAQRVELTNGFADLRRHVFVTSGGEERPLRELEARLLGVLAASPDTVLSYAALLESVWGYHPDHTLSVIHTTVRRLRRVIGDPARSPEHIFNVRGEGFRFVPLAQAAPATAPAGPSADPQAALVGRQAELAAIEAALEERTLVTVTGPGGAGKTRIAQAAARRLGGRFPGGVHFVDLSEARTRVAVCAAIGQALGVQLATTSPEHRLLRALLARREVLLILDNFEQVAASAGSLVEDWARALRQGRLLVTSRVALGVDGEHRVELGPLAVPAPGADVAAVQAADAAALFTLRARKARPDFALTADNAEHVGALVRLLDGLPLALELAAARAHLMGPRTMRARLERDLLQLRDTRGERPGRHASLQATLEWSMGLLAEPVRDLLVRCAVFEGPFTLAAAEQILAPGEGGRPLDEDIDVLLASSLLQPRPPTGDEPCFGLLQTVQEHLLARLMADGPAYAALCQAHAAHYAADLDEQAHPELDGIQRNLRALGALDNLRAAVRRAQGQPAARCADLLLNTLRRIGSYQEGLEIIDQALGREDFSPRWRAQLQSWQVTILGDLGDPRAAEASEQLLERIDQLEEASTMGNSVNALAVQALRQGELERAGRLLEHALRLFEQGGAEERVGAVLGDIGMLRVRQGDIVGAEKAYHQALHVFRRIRARSREGLVLGYLGTLHIRIGKIDVGIRYLEQALELHRQNRFHRFVSLTLANLAETRVRKDQWEQAHQLFSEALSVAQRIDDDVLILFAQARRAVADVERGELIQAEADSAQALARSEALSDPEMSAIALHARGRVMKDLGRLEEAEQMFSWSLDAAERLGSPALQGLAWLELARVSVEQGATGEARDQLSSALAFCQESQERMLLIDVLLLQAELDPEQGALDTIRAELQRADLPDDHSFARRLSALDGHGTSRLETP